MTAKRPNPIPHHQLIQTVQHTLAATNLKIGSQAHSLTHDGSRYFGIMEIIQRRKSSDDYCWVLGLKRRTGKTALEPLIFDRFSARECASCREISALVILLTPIPLGRLRGEPHLYGIYHPRIAQRHQRPCSRAAPRSRHRGHGPRIEGYHRGHAKEILSAVAAAFDVDSEDLQNRVHQLPKPASAEEGKYIVHHLVRNRSGGAFGRIEANHALHKYYAGPRLRWSDYC